MVDETWRTADMEATREMLDIEDLVKEAHDCAVTHGFWEASENIGEKLALIHSEVSEALEAYRKDEPLDEELADVMIRVADLAGWLKIDLSEAIINKMIFNETRPRLHGKKV
jgi:NTP pyrophosphatase (non-canonical NTP hydrolase)